MDEAVYWIWLQQALGVGTPQGASLLAQFDTVHDIYRAAYFPDSAELKPMQRTRLLNKDLKKAERELERLTALGGFVITPADDVYTTLFEGMYDPPVVIYGRGTCFDPCDVLRITVVGTRDCDDNGKRVTRRITAGLAAGGAVIVSGGADGLDAVAMNAAMDQGGRVISYQACGIDIEYPKVTSELRKRLLESGGMLLSEFPLGTQTRRHSFRIRNRLLAASSHGTLVTEAPHRSGAVMTAHLARDQGRDVFSVPGTVGVPCCEGSNELLKEGATPVTNAADILMTYIHRYPLGVDIEAAVLAEEQATAPNASQPAVPLTETVLKVAQAPEEEKPPVPCPAGVSPAVQAVYTALTARAQTPAELSRATALPAGEVLSSLTILELYGAVTCTAGQRYVLCRRA